MVYAFCILNTECIELHLRLGDLDMRQSKGFTLIELLVVIAIIPRVPQKRRVRLVRQHCYNLRHREGHTKPSLRLPAEQ